MSEIDWGEDALRRLLISQQEVYPRRGLEHALFAETDEAFHRRWIYHRLIVLSLIPPECRTPGTRVIDVGGGKGRMTTLLSDLGLQCVNIDILFLDEHAKNVEGRPLVPLLRAYCEEKGVKVVAQDALQDGIPLADQSFDLVICTEVIEHLPNSPKPMLSEIHRTLVEGGWLILTTPNASSYEKRRAVLFGRSVHTDFAPFYNLQRGYPAGTVYRGHVREYTRPEVEQMLVWEGFDIVRSETCDFCAATQFRDLVSCWRRGRIGLRLILKRAFPDLCQHVVVLARK